jgi:hypothetical protein
MITMRPGAPASTRVALLHGLLAGSCDVPGEQLLRYFGRWDRHARRFTIELSPDDPAVVMAERATTCQLRIGEPGPTPELGFFPTQPFSVVRMR